MNRKLKKCSGCGKDSYLWKSNPPLCKSCAMKGRARSDDSDKKVSVPHKKKKVPKRIAPVSEKQKERLAEYRKIRDEYLKENPKCKCCGGGPVELHHGAGRQGNLLTDVRYFVALCRGCHRLAEEKPEWAKKSGLSFSRLDK